MIGLVTLSTALAADATTDTDWLGDVLEAELTRSIEQLSLPDAPELYHLRYQTMRLDQVDVHASMGSVVRSNVIPQGLLGVEVRVGTPELDNTGFGGWQDGFGRSGLPAHLTPEALATAAWRLTDSAYKEAVEQRARKVAQWTPPDTHPGDYTLTGPVVADLGSASAHSDPGPLTQLATAISGALAGPELMLADVYVGHEAGDLRIVDSEGTDVRTPVQETTVRAVVMARASDGALVTDQRLWTVRDPSDLPSEAQMVAQAGQLRADLLATVAATPMAEEYVGPVIFEGEAARTLFRYVLIPQLQGTPPEIPFDSFFGDLGDDQDPVRLGRRVLPDEWTAADDPQRAPSHPGSYTHDMEGTPASAVQLITDGIVRDLAMTRVPRRGLGPTNGHARGMVGTRQTARVTQLQVQPDRHRSRRALRRKALRVARDYGRDHVLVVRRLQEPSMLRLADGTWFDAVDEGTALPPPVAVYRVRADGSEERLRGARFAAVQRWILRDILSAGPQSEGSFMAPLRGSYASLSPTEGVASWLSAPDVLVGEVELVPTSADPRDVPVLTAPPLP